MEIQIKADPCSPPADLRSAGLMLVALADAREAALAGSPTVTATLGEFQATGQDVTASGGTHGALNGGEANTSNLQKEPCEDDAKSLDEKGVEFDDEFCGQSEKPFYTSGKMSGQWKKKRGVDQATYDAWYAEALTAVDVSAAGDAGGTTQEPVDTAAAFSAPATDGPASDEVPKDVGALMLWISERQTGGHITPEQVTAAYTAANLTPQDIFPSVVNTPEVVAPRLAALFDSLQAQASA